MYNMHTSGIQSLPGNITFPVSSSAMIQPTDQISTEERRQLHVSGLEVLGLSSQGDLSVHNASTGAELPELASSEW